MYNVAIGQVCTRAVGSPQEASFFVVVLTDFYSSVFDRGTRIDISWDTIVTRTANWESFFKKHYKASPGFAEAFLHVPLLFSQEEQVPRSLVHRFLFRLTLSTYSMPGTV